MPIGHFSMDYALKKISKPFIVTHLKAKITKSHQEVLGIMHCYYVMMTNQKRI